jgi:hypothetical protein
MNFNFKNVITQSSTFHSIEPYEILTNTKESTPQFIFIIQHFCNFRTFKTSDTSDTIGETFDYQPKGGRLIPSVLNEANSFAFPEVFDERDTLFFSLLFSTVHCWSQRKHLKWASSI